METVPKYDIKRNRLASVCWLTLSRYGLAVSFVSAALLLALLTYRSASGAYVYLFLGAVVASAWFGRKGPGLFASVLAALVLDYFFLPPYHTLGIGRAAWPHVFPFLLSALVTAWLSSKLKLDAEESARLSCAVEQAAGGIAITDTSANIQYVNPGFT